ncbi:MULTISPECIES: hypothetical protein [Legionella]|uniref:Uncharacterized protein n=2 Tax=Legionella TaxID=445 RepID=A0A0W0SAI9_9GAMM|nr:MULTISPECIES: hypothetical protein [Legionella]KTC80137.1 hypothetical protein Lche_2157 [Legionella cherrii]MCL9682844.1 hypothetical protein [Legionella maioricensis]MCL9686528.1 hypothetical protein [Legionella maioricensis]
MGTQYRANIYYGADEIAHQSGDNMEQLYVWMLAYVEKTSGEIHGEIIDNITHQVVR